MRRSRTWLLSHGESRLNRSVSLSRYSYGQTFVGCTLMRHKIVFASETIVAAEFAVRNRTREPFGIGTMLGGGMANQISPSYCGVVAKRLRTFEGAFAGIKVVALFMANEIMSPSEAPAASLDAAVISVCTILDSRSKFLTFYANATLISGPAMVDVEHAGA